MSRTNAINKSALHLKDHYKWIALTNTTLGVLMASINGTILIIALPAIFAGIHVNPLNQGQSSLLLWVLLGFNVATTIFLVAFGRISDTYGRVKLYNLGFAIFTLGSILLFITPSQGISGEWELIIFRFIQGIGGAFLFSNSTAILTDAFPANQRGFALGLNQIASVGGSVIGLVVGGLLAVVNWRLIFLVSVPVGLIGTIWGYMSLKEMAKTRDSKHLDFFGNITFALGLLAILIGLTYGILPYGKSPMGWSNPWIITALVVGVVLLLAFIQIERTVKDPMFHLDLFKNQAFSLGNLSGLLSSIARGGLQFMLIIWLQGIWLPLHGVSYANTPLLAGVATLPQMVGFLLAGPLSGWISDRLGARWFGFAGMMVSGVGFFLLNTLPADFSYIWFAIYVFIIGAGMGMFASPNTSMVMNAVPPRFRGVASGMRATFLNGGMMMSMGIFFSIVITNLSGHLPSAMLQGLSHYQLPPALVHGISGLPPTAALFAAMLGYNPMASLIPAAALHALPASQAAQIVGREFFPNLIAVPFMLALRAVFIFALVMSVIAAFASLFSGKKYIFDEEANSLPSDNIAPQEVAATRLHPREGE